MKYTFICIKLIKTMKVVTKKETTPSIYLIQEGNQFEIH